MAINVPNQLKKLQQRKELLVILLFLFVIALLWIALGIFSSQQQSILSGEDRQLAAPLTPNLDITVIEGLAQKKVYSQQELADFPIYIVQASQGATLVVESQGSSQPQGEVILPEELEGVLEGLEGEL